MDPTARPKAYGEVNVPSNVPDVELLDDDDGDSDGVDEPASHGSDGDHGDEMAASSDDEANQESSDDDDMNDDVVSEGEDDGNSVDDSDGGVSIDEESSEDEEDDLESDDEEAEEAEGEQIDDHEIKDDASGLKGSKEKKRKLSDFDTQLISADTSLRALKKLAGGAVNNASDSADGILSNDDFRRIKELKVRGFFFLCVCTDCSSFSLYS